ncbi:MAG: type VII secretion protein EccB [Bifidobacteriaceae bacterium]|jgi:type VII secretion protein EccB|nr:type VII secretion protein EccB [Bifidobacteriaceae bacterium]
MATKKELAQAQSFARRRLLTAFTSGIPGGKELEPARPARTVVAGVALAVLVVLGGLGFGLLSPSLPDGWDNNHLILIKGEGSRYVTQNGVLYPVANTASARLVVPAGELTTITVAAKQLDGLERGPAIGIVGAPDELPAADRLIKSGWSACLAEGAVATDLRAGEPAAEVSSASLLATVPGQTDTVWLISGGRRHPIAAGAIDGVAMFLGLGASATTEVPSLWLNLFAPGSELTGFEIPGAGGAAAHEAEVEGRQVRIGSMVRIAAGERTRTYVVTENSQLAELTPTAAALYEYGLKPDQQALAPVTAQGGQMQAFTFSSELKYPADWPQTVNEPMDSSARPCALTTGEADPADAVRLATATAEAPNQAGVTVQKGHGALFTPSDSASGSATYPFLVDHSGTAYAINNAPEATLAQLGYSAEDLSVAPRSWIALFTPGPALDPAAAGLPISASLEAQTGAEETDSADLAGAQPAAAATANECDDRVNNLMAGRPAALDTIQLSDAEVLATGKGVRVALVDSGVDASNRHFIDPEGIKHTVEDGWDFRYNGGTPPDPDVDQPPEGQIDNASGKVDSDGHGTAVAGLVAARTVAGSGLRGVAPGATIIPIRVYVNGSEEAAAVGHAPTEDNLAAGISAAVAAGADIINISMSTDTDHAGVREAVAAAQAAGALVVAAAGNVQDAGGTANPPWYGPDGSVYQVRYPAAYDAVVGVAAASTETGLVGAGALHGPQVDISAPGTNIVSTYLNGGDCGINGDEPSSSFATGYVSGAAALLAELYPDAGPEYWAYRLTATALRPRADSSDQLAGWGLLQVHDALTATLDASIPGPPPPGGSADQVAGGAAVPLVDPQSQSSPLEPIRAVAAPAAITALAVVAVAYSVSARRAGANRGNERASRRAPGPRL